MFFIYLLGAKQNTPLKRLWKSHLRCKIIISLHSFRKMTLKNTEIDEDLMLCLMIICCSLCCSTLLNNEITLEKEFAKSSL